MTAPSLDLFLRDIEAGDMSPRLQPIVDLAAAEVTGFEILARGPAPYESPAMMFHRARQIGLVYELEQACVTAALRTIRDAAAPSGCRWFLNVTPEVFCESDASESAGQVRAAGVEPASIVIEITERDTTIDYAKLRRAVRQHAEQGFRIALDDFGAGSSGLVALVSCMPHIIKLDMELTRDINTDPYKQNVVRSIVTLAASVDAQLIAEGVETWQELEMLARQGVRYAQGYLFREPSRTIEPLGDDVTETLRGMVARRGPARAGVEEPVAALVSRTLAVQRGSMSCGELEAMFHDDADLECTVVVDGECPVGIITRAHLLSQMGGRFGYSLSSHRAVESLMKSLTLLVDEAASVVRLATLAMEREREDLYDPVVIVREDGALSGIVTIRQLIVRAAELELAEARECNPLTLLPGNRQVQSWISEALATGGTLLYADLDRFKEFNDTFGFLLGDEAIRMTGQLLAAHLDELCPGARLGHLGGDDFVVVAPGEVSLRAVEVLCASFDEEKTLLFDEETLRSGIFVATDRTGNQTAVPLTTLSVALVSSRQLGRSAHPALLSQVAATLKHAAKKLSRERRRSSYVVEQRFHPGRI